MLKRSKKMIFEDESSNKEVFDESDNLTDSLLNAKDEGEV